jgi:ABC-type cobalamin transport system ATPase subunit
MSGPELWLIAGPNGAGKTTCTHKEPLASLLSGVGCLNPDDQTLRKLRAAGYAGFADAPPKVQTPPRQTKACGHKKAGSPPDTSRRYHRVTPPANDSCYNFV